MKLFISSSVFKALGIALVLLSLSFVSLDVGSQGDLATKFLFSTLSDEERFVLFELRFPRLLFAFAVGGILALSGLTYQSLFSNPIASPYTLGVSGGAAVGYMLATHFLSRHLPSGLGWVFSTLGGGAVLLVLFPFLASSARKSPHLVLLMGVLMSLFTGSILFFLQYFLDPAGLVQMTAWYFGSLNVVGLTVPLSLLMLSLFLLFAIFSFSASLDLILFGPEYAESQGVSVKALQGTLISFTTLALALLISFAGPIGFIGLIIPHFGRACVGSAHRRLVPFTYLSGSGFVVFSDLMARGLGGTQEIPIGLLTALIGCPVMALLLLRQER